MTEKRMPNKNAAAGAPRRNFITFLWVGLGIAAFAELVWVVGAFLRPGQKGRPLAGPARLVDAGAVEAFLPGTVTAFPRGRFYLARLDDGGFLALSRRCPHLGCTLPWMEEEHQFVCPCHASAFDIRGDVIRSPAPRGLDLYPVTIENAVVKVDLGQVLRRDRFPSVAAVYPPQG
ncbi:MAG: Rieske (2Fe-2S) protein [Desulfobacterales bacterium]|jgi:cytochrome b6-f complex iron-sulfur subunit